MKNVYILEINNSIFEIPRSSQKLTSTETYCFLGPKTRIKETVLNIKIIILVEYMISFFLNNVKGFFMIGQNLSSKILKFSD